MQYGRVSMLTLPTKPCPKITTNGQKHPDNKLVVIEYNMNWKVTAAVMEIILFRRNEAVTEKSKTAKLIYKYVARWKRSRAHHQVISTRYVYVLLHRNLLLSSTSRHECNYLQYVISYDQIHSDGSVRGANYGELFQAFQAMRPSQSAFGV